MKKILKSLFSFPSLDCNCSKEQTCNSSIFVGMVNGVPFAMYTKKDNCTVDY